MKENYTHFELKAPYYTLGELSESTTTVWFVCHGYGQLSRFFLRKFSVLDQEKNFFIFPQGLSKFYLDNHSRVGATWMTKEDRLTEIENQYKYLDSVLHDELGDDLSRWNINLFGFSQGVSTITRYAVYRKLIFSKLILWAGAIPVELKREDFDFITEGMKVQMLLGDKDKYYTEEAYSKQVDNAKDLMGNAVHFSIFKGDHQIVVDELLKL